ncbi:MAG: hypothetical protein ACYTX0_32485, partial [Nostoc sp.]
YSSCKMWLEGVSFLIRSTIPALSQYRSVKDIYLLGRAVFEQGKQGEKKGLTQAYCTLSTIYGCS